MCVYVYILYILLYTAHHQKKAIMPMIPISTSLGHREASLMVAPEWLSFTVSLYELVAWKVLTADVAWRDWANHTWDMGYDTINGH